MRVSVVNKHENYTNKQLSLTEIYIGKFVEQYAIIQRTKTFFFLNVFTLHFYMGKFIINS